MKRSPLHRRSELKRGTTPLKRTGIKRNGKPINRRSKTNSRPHEDRAVFHSYKDANPTCELLPLLTRFNGPEWAQFAKGLRNHSPVECHHIVHVGNRPDVWGNLITLCVPAHGWCHKHPIEGRIACWAVKAEKGELDVAQVQAVCGVNVVGWLEMRTAAIDWFEGLKRELIERVK